MNNTTQNLSQNKQDELIKLDLRRWFYRILSYWWLFVICLGAAMFGGYYYVKNAVPLYSTDATLLIKDAGKSGGISEVGILLAEGLAGGGKSMDNEIQILKSLTLMEKVVDKLGANVTYYKEKEGKEVELYTDFPLLLDTFAFIGERPFGLSFYLEIKNDKSFGFRYSEGGTFNNCKYNEIFTNDGGIYQLSLREGGNLIPGIYRVQIRPKELVAYSFKGRVFIQRIGSQTASSILSLQMTDPLPARARDVVNTLIQVYNEEEIEDKNRVLLSTLDFIDERVKILTKELDIVEGGIQDFKSRNSILTDNAASSRSYAVGEIRSALDRLSDLEVKKELLSSLETLVRSDLQNKELIPANLIADNPVLGGLVGQYNSSLLERDRLVISASAQNPTLILLEQQMIDVRTLIIETIQNLRRDLSIPMRTIQSKIDNLERNISTVPSMEKALLEQKRTQSIKENLFLFLLQKREETALSEAVTAPNTRIVDRARTPKFPIFPQKRMIYMASAALGLIFPLLLVTLLGFFETKIQAEDMITDLTSIPILGRIALSTKKEDIVVKKGTRSAIAEMFRLLRTNLNYLNVKNEKQVLAITSSVSGEGKSFIGLNLAMTIALSNKKVILLGMDLRKPKMHQYLGVENGIGISNYLVQQAELEDVIHVFPDNKNLSYITSGAIPPNPAELILSDRMDELIKRLKEEYDYIIIDTPPIGLVSDALLLRQYVSNILVVVRQKYTKKAMVRDLETLYKNGELKGAGLVFNAVKMGRGYYGYGGYNYGYGQGYYTSEED